MLKRFFDIIVASFVLLVFLPIGIVLAIWISIDSKGGVFYSQQRMGQHKKPFRLLKFRSMRPNAEREGKLTVGMRDPRITRSGYFIRKYKLDEFPQFINVLKGDMSIVGPRPEVEEYVALYTNEQQQVFQVKPGITDLASLHYFHENDLLAKSPDPRATYIEEIMPAKLELNLKYIEQVNLFNDIRIMWITFMKMLRQ